MAQLPPIPPLSQPARPHRIRITLSHPDELQVTQGQTINMGDILTERTGDRIRLETQRLELEAQRLTLESTSPPTQIELQQRILQYQQAQQTYDNQYHLVSQLQQLEVAPSVLRQEIEGLQQLYSALLNAHTQAQQAHLTHQQQVTTHRIEQDTQRQLLTQQLQQVQQDRGSLTIRAPFAGSISRIRWLDQENTTLTVEVTIQP